MLPSLLRRALRALMRRPRPPSRSEAAIDKRPSPPPAETAAQNGDATEGPFASTIAEINRWTRRTLPPDDRTAERILDLRQRLIRLNHRQRFKVGDVVGWKKGLQNHLYPEGGAVAIVSEVPDKPFVLKAKDGFAFADHDEMCDLRVLCITREDNWGCEFYVDSRRMTKFV